MSAGEPQVAWIAIEQDADVYAADGSRVGTMKEVAGDEEHDIFDGLVVSCPGFETARYIPAERVKGIWPTRIETDLSGDDVARLGQYTPSRVTRWHADEGRGFGARVKRAFNDLFRR